MEDLEFQIVDGGLWSEDRQSRFEASIMPHQHLIYVFLFIHRRKSRYYEDIVEI